MQVKISFTVDLDDVPDRVQKEITESMHKLRFVYESDIVELNKENVLSKINWIDRARKELLQVDNKLSDCYHILVGYNKAVAQSLVPKVQEEQQGERTAEDVPSES